jgi:hypothetical protein
MSPLKYGLSRNLFLFPDRATRAEVSEARAGGGVRRSVNMLAVAT